IGIRFSEEEKNFLEELSKNNNQSLSQLIRKMLSEAIFNIKKERHISSDNSEGIETLLNKVEILTKRNNEMQGTLNKVFVLLVQLASKEFDSEEIKNILESSLKLKREVE
ncbi:DUF6290 family protein, partial [Pseudomonadota bacterium]